MMLSRRNDERHGTESATPLRTLLYCRLGRQLVMSFFALFARAIGLRSHPLPDMNELARLSNEYYPNELRGGEGHLEVGKVILGAHERTADLLLSVKPFGCMPSSAVSDGIQALVTARFPEVNFLSVETTGDSAANVYSRIQMALFKARARAEMTFATALGETGLTKVQAIACLASRPRLRHALYVPPKRTAVTAANILHALR
jgi:hypothetical protein